MPTLLVVHHTPSPTLQELLEQVLAGAAEVPEVTVRTRAALACGAADVLAADAVILGTPANIGYMSGALKHFFDTVYYPVLAETVGLRFGLYVHGGNEVTGAVRSVQTITKGLSWRAVRPPVESVGELTAAAREACWELGAVLAADLVG